MGQTVIELIENSEGRQELWQWDLGRKVRVIPAEGITVDEVHFGNVFSGEALVVEPKVDETTGDIVANVPNILITQFFRINVYAVMVIPDGKITTERIMLDIEAREKPSDYVYTETEIKNYDALEKRIEELEKNGGGSGKPGADGFSPIASVEQTEDGAEITITDKNGTTKATVKNGKDGKDAADGKDGLNGKDGADGKTAYQYAKDGGYTGTEEEFAQKMAKELPTKLSDLENDLELEVEGTVEITDGEPTKASTVMTLNPNAEEVNLYTAEEFDEVISKLSEDIANLKQNGTGENTGFSDAFIDALSAFMDGVAYACTNGQALKQNVLEAMNASGGTEEPDEPPIEPDEPDTPTPEVTYTLTSIVLTLNASQANVDTETKTLIKSVVGTYLGSDGSTKTQGITGYTVSPTTIAEGTNNVTVSYGGKTSNVVSVTGNVVQSSTYSVQRTYGDTVFGLDRESDNTYVASFEYGSIKYSGCVYKKNESEYATSIKIDRGSVAFNGEWLAVGYNENTKSTLAIQIGNQSLFGRATFTFKEDGTPTQYSYSNGTASNVFNKDTIISTSVDGNDVVIKLDGIVYQIFTNAASNGYVPVVGLCSQNDILNMTGFKITFIEE